MKCSGDRFQLLTDIHCSDVGFSALRFWCKASYYKTVDWRIPDTGGFRERHLRSGVNGEAPALVSDDGSDADEQSEMSWSDDAGMDE